MRLARDDVMHLMNYCIPTSPLLAWSHCPSSAALYPRIHFSLLGAKLGFCSWKICLACLQSASLLLFLILYLHKCTAIFIHLIWRKLVLVRFQQFHMIQHLNKILAEFENRWAINLRWKKMKMFCLHHQCRKWGHENRNILQSDHEVIWDLYFSPLPCFAYVLAFRRGSSQRSNSEILLKNTAGSLSSDLLLQWH